jgi:hypothetical protein
MPLWGNRRMRKIGNALKGAPYARAIKYVVDASSQRSNSTSRTMRRNAAIIGSTLTKSGFMP